MEQSLVGKWGITGFSWQKTFISPRNPLSPFQPSSAKEPNRVA